MKVITILPNDFSIEDYFIDTGKISKSFFVICDHKEHTMNFEDKPPLFVKKTASSLWTNKRSEVQRFFDIELAEKALKKTGGFVLEAEETDALNVFRVLNWTWI